MAYRLMLSKEGVFSLHTSRCKYGTLFLNTLLLYRGAFPFSVKVKTNTFLDLKFPHQCLSTLEISRMFSHVEWEVCYLYSGEVYCFQNRVQQS